MDHPKTLEKKRHQDEFKNKNSEGLKNTEPKNI
jgi:hypothetical protein